MIKFIIGAAAGIAGSQIFNKSQTSSKDEVIMSQKTLLEQINRDNQNLKNQINSLRNDKDELLNTIKSLKREARNAVDSADDQLDYVEDLNLEIKTLKSKNSRLEENIEELKDLNAAAQQEIDRLKNS